MDGILEGGEDFIEVVSSSVEGFGSWDGGGVVEDSLGGNVVFGDGGVKLFSVLEKLLFLNRIIHLLCQIFRLVVRLLITGFATQLRLQPFLIF